MAAVLALAFLLGVAGCGSPQATEPTAEAQRKQALQEVGEMYRMYVATTKKAPTKVGDLQGTQVAAPAGYNALKNGDIVVKWGTALTDTSEEGSKDSADEVLAYEKAVPTGGGDVLMKNRTIKTMTADEFKAAPK